MTITKKSEKLFQQSSIMHKFEATSVDIEWVDREASGWPPANTGVERRGESAGAQPDLD